MIISSRPVTERIASSARLTGLRRTQHFRPTGTKRMNLSIPAVRTSRSRSWPGSMSSISIRGGFGRVSNNSAAAIDQLIVLARGSGDWQPSRCFAVFRPHVKLESLEPFHSHLRFKSQARTASLGKLLAQRSNVK